MSETRTTVIGMRVKLLSTTDPYTKLQRGDEGVVTDFDALGTMFVKWDNGSNLGLIMGEDNWLPVEIGNGK